MRSVPLSVAPVWLQSSFHGNQQSFVLLYTVVFPKGHHLWRSNVYSLNIKLNQSLIWEVWDWKKANREGSRWVFNQKVINKK